MFKIDNNWLNETRRWMGILVENGDILYTDKLLTESQESKSIDAAKKLVIQKLNYTPKQADEFIRIDLRNKLPVLRDKNAAKFILGATRMYIDGELNNAQTINNLNSTLKYIASDAHINEYDRNLNGMSSGDLIERFSSNIEADIENDRNKVNAMQFEGNSQYDIVRIDDFNQSSQYGDYTGWCVTHDANAFYTYSCNGVNQIYFCLKKGFENVEPVPGKGCPLDEYGLSMISVIVNEKGALAFCTSRWNHSNGGNDHVMDDTTQISKEIGMNFYQVFKPNNKWKEILDNAMRELRNGEDPDFIFDRLCDNGSDGYLVNLHGRWNYINCDYNIPLPNLWFDCIWYLHDGWMRVKINRKYNYLNEKGDLLLNKPVNQWLDAGFDFNNGLAWVGLNRKDYYIDTEGNLYDYETEKPLGMNINNMDNQNESVRDILTNMIVEKLIHQMKK